MKKKFFVVMYVLLASGFGVMFASDEQQYRKRDVPINRKQYAADFLLAFVMFIPCVIYGVSVTLRDKAKAWLERLLLALDL